MRTSLIHRLGRGLRRVAGRLPADPQVAPLRAQLLAWRAEPRRTSSAATPAPKSALAGRVLAVQGVEDPMFYGLLAALASDLQQATGVRPSLLQVRSINGAIGTGLLPALARSVPLSALLNAQWRRAHAGLIEDIGYRSAGWGPPGAAARRRRRARKLIRDLPEGGLGTLSIAGILVGDLLIDSYLRFRPAVTVDLQDPFLVQLLAQLLRDLDLAQNWFARKRPALYLSSYSTYVEHGVAVRVALARGVPVRVFGNLVTFGKRLSLQDPYHAANGDGYDAIAASLTEPALARAAAMLERRLSGQIDAATSYMRQSAYAASGEPVPDVRGAVVVFLHDFFDSPHVYADLVFDDFWQWVGCTIRTLQAAGIPFYLKPHPNQVQASADVLVQLQATFPGVRLLSTRVTNRQLAEAGLGAGVTVYGTVGHELAYLGVPVISCARHPHHEFGFCRTAASVSEYEAMLRQPFERALPREAMRQQASQFYYAHNLHGSDQALALRSRFANLFKAGGDTTDPTAVAAALVALRSEPAWAEFVQDLVHDMSSPSRGS